MVKNEHFAIGLLHTLSVIFFMGGIFLDYYSFMTGLFVLIAVSILTNFLRQQTTRSKPKKKFSSYNTTTQKSTKVNGSNAFCIHCGVKLSNDDEYCPSCGSLNED